MRLVDGYIGMPNILPAGETTFLVRNDDIERHSFQMEGQGLIARVPEDLAPGESGIMKVELKPGRYRVFCPIESHTGKDGMSAWLNVT